MLTSRKLQIHVNIKSDILMKNLFEEKWEQDQLPANHFNLLNINIMYNFYIYNCIFSYYFN